KMGRDVSNYQPDVAPELGALDAVLRLPGRYSEGDLYDECHRVAKHVVAQGDQNTGLVSERGCGDETAVPGVGTYCQEVDDAGTELESGLAALCNSAGRPRPARRAGIVAARKGDRRQPRAVDLRRPHNEGPSAKTCGSYAPSSVDASSQRGTKPYGFFPL